MKSTQNNSRKISKKKLEKAWKNTINVKNAIFVLEKIRE